MMAQHGGARVPTNPAAVSGPGALSKRTDGQPVRSLPNAGYGENAAFESIQQGAPLATASGGGAAGGTGGGGNPLASIVGLGAPSMNPDEPVTAGAAAGPGAGPESLGLPQTPGEETQADARSLHPGMVTALVRASMRDEATPSLKRLVRDLIANR